MILVVLCCCESVCNRRTGLHHVPLAATTCTGARTDVGIVPCHAQMAREAALAAGEEPPEYGDEEADSEEDEEEVRMERVSRECRVAEDRCRVG